MVTYHEGFPPLKSHDPLNTTSQELNWQIKVLHLHYHNIYSHQTWQGDILLGVLTHKVTLSFITWSCEVMWKIKYVMSPLSRDQWPPNMARCWLPMREFHPWVYITLYTRSHVSSRNQIKKYLRCSNTYGHQTWKGGDLLWGAPTHKITWPFNHAVFRLLSKHFCLQPSSPKD